MRVGSSGPDRGWFDKFTGDGFLAYWICDDEADLMACASAAALPGCAYVLHQFHSHLLDRFRRNSRNLPDEAGLAIGIDAGPTYVVDMGGDYTIVGPAVVGAVRMVSAATTPGDVLCNVFLAVVSKTLDICRRRSRTFGVSGARPRSTRRVRKHTSLSFQTRSTQKRSSTSTRRSCVSPVRIT